MTTRTARRLGVMTAAALALGPAATATAAPAPTKPAAAVAAAEDSTDGKLLLMLDASGSMKEKDPSGGTKMAAAKKALTGVVDSLPDTSKVGLRVYGATEPGGRPTPKACRDTQLVAPVQPLDKPGLKKAIAGFTAKGETPIAHSLEQALKDVGTDGKRNIVLVSDGEESCVPDPCPSIKKLVGQGVDLQIDTVGFGVNAKARKQLQCLAEAGHGTYYDAADADALATSLAKLSQRSLRPYGFAGTPVDGNRRQADAPSVTAGQYLDKVPVDEDGVWYRVKRSPGSTIRVTATSRPGYGALFDKESVRIELTTEDGESCDVEHANRTDAFVSSAQPVIAAARTKTVKPGGATAGADPCLDEATLLANVAREAGKGEAPVEVTVIEEAPVTNVTDLEEAPRDDTPKPDPVAASTPVQAVVGGTSFNDSANLTPGTYEDVVIPGESLYYRARLEEGQQAVWTVDVPDAKDLSKEATTQVHAHVHAPDRGALMSESISVGEHELDTETSVWTPRLRYQNRWPNHHDDAGISATRIGHASLEGDYTLALHTGSLGGDGSGHPEVPVRIRLEIVGEPTTGPAYETEVSGLSPSPSNDSSTGTAGGDPSTDDAPAEGTSEEGNAPWLVIGLGVLAALAAAGAAALVLRSRRRPKRPA